MNKANRATSLLAMSQRVIEKELGVKNFDPVIFLARLAADDTQDMALRKDAAKAAAPYFHSTFKAIEVTTKESPEDINLVSAKERLASMLEAVSTLATPDLEVIDVPVEKE